jgi:hypothetical protein
MIHMVILIMVLVQMFVYLALLNVLLAQAILGRASVVIQPIISIMAPVAVLVPQVFFLTIRLGNVLTVISIVLM